MKKIIGFYHSADHDGQCSGAILHRRFGDGIELIGIDYGQSIPWEYITSETEVYMCDFSLRPFDHMVAIHDLAGRFVWLDHHESAIKEYDKYLKDGGVEFDGIQRSDKSGCELTWEWFYHDLPKPLAVDLLGRYDVWDHSDERVVPFEYGLRLKNTTPCRAIWNRLLSYDCDIVNENIATGEHIIQYQFNQNEITAKKLSFETEFEGLTAIACNTTITGSKFYDSVKKPEHKIFITFHIDPALKKWVCHLYSDDPTVNVGEIAKSYGGGGHKGAGGFKVNYLPFKVPVITVQVVENIELSNR